MRRIKVTCQINDYSNPAQPSIKVHAHWNESKMVVIEIDGKEYTVSGKELKIAIDNAMNTGDWI